MQMYSQADFSLWCGVDPAGGAGGAQFRSRQRLIRWDQPFGVTADDAEAVAMRLRLPAAESALLVFLDELAAERRSGPGLF